MLDIDGLARLYDTQITAILDDLVPVATVICRRRPSDPWFDDECAGAKLEVRRLERAAGQDDPSKDGAATAEWDAARHGYCVESVRSFGGPRSTLRVRRHTSFGSRSTR